jgi:hypothetical protein
MVIKSPEFNLKIGKPTGKLLTSNVVGGVTIPYTLILFVSWMLTTLFLYTLILLILTKTSHVVEFNNPIKFFSSPFASISSKIKYE